MKRISLICFSIIIFSIFSCRGNIEGTGLGNQTKDYILDSYVEIEAKGNFNLILIPNDKPGVKVESHQNIIDNLSVGIEGNTLIIEEKAEVSSFKLYNVFVQFNRNVSQIVVKGGAVVSIDGSLNTDELNLTLEDEVKWNQSTIFSKRLDIETRDNADILLNGEVAKLNIKAKNESDLDLFGLKASEANIEVNDNVHLKINAQNLLSGSVEDQAEVTYIGNPEKETKIKGKAEINKKSN